MVHLALLWWHSCSQLLWNFFKPQKIWLQIFKFCYKQVQGKDRQLVQSTAEQLGLEGSFIPRTYIEQIQLEKLINEVMVCFAVRNYEFVLITFYLGSWLKVPSQALPDDLKNKLSLDEDLVSSSSPKEALLRASADRVAMRNKNLKRYTSFEECMRKLCYFQPMCP